MQISLTEKDYVKIILIESETLDASNTNAFKSAMAPHLTREARVLLDLSRLRFVDSSGLGAMLSCLRRLNGVGGDLRLFGLNKEIRTLFELVRMHRVFEIYNAKEDAVRSWALAPAEGTAD